MYNGLVGKKNAVETQFSGIDVQLKKRFDLIPNLVASVKEYAKHERELLENVTALREKAMKAADGDDTVAATNLLNGALGSLMVRMEAYPDLKASENFQDLQRQLAISEQEISASRRSYNIAVEIYNNAIEMIPTNIMARWMGYKQKTLFEIPETERENVNVSAMFNS